MIDYITQIDFSILTFIQENLRCELLDHLMVFFSLIGEAGLVWFLIAVPMLFFKKTRVCGVAMILSMGIVLLLGEFGMKNVFCRVRPCNVNQEIELLVKRPSSYSFPSGHTGSSFAAATSVFLYHKKAGICTLVLAALIGFSRLYNYVHFPSDVLVGMLFGIIMSVVVYNLFKRYKLDNKIENLKFSRKG